MSKLFVDEIVHQSSQGSGTITLGASGETVSLGSGVTSKVNEPYFQVERDAEQSISDATVTKIQWDTVTFDTGSYFNATDYSYKPLVAGKYFVYAQTYPDSQGNSDLDDCFMYLYKNGSEIFQCGTNFGDNDARNTTLNLSFIVDMNGTSDYLDVRLFIDDNSGTPRIQATKNTFSAFRIG
jgi:hypothetical protein